jgi:hypothetical protein
MRTFGFLDSSLGQALGVQPSLRSQAPQKRNSPPFFGSLARAGGDGERAGAREMQAGARLVRAGRLGLPPLFCAR